MADVLTVVAKIRAAKGKGDALAALSKEQVAAVMKAEPGCIVYRPHRSSKDPDVFIFYEQCKDDAAFDAHRKAPHLAAYRERREREGLTEGPPVDFLKDADKAKILGGNAARLLKITNRLASMGRHATTASKGPVATGRAKK
jgi:quinol monooxygenase YgiN